MNFEIIPNYQHKGLRCHFCGETRSVKYYVNISGLSDGKLSKVCACNKCVWNAIKRNED